MMLTDDELTTMISGRYADAGLTVTLDAVEHRGRQRRRNSKIALGAAMALVVVAAIGGTAFAVNRHATAQAAAAFDRACQASYTVEAAATRHATQSPARLGRPVIELSRAKATFRLYAAKSGKTRAMIFDCYRAADGSVTGRVSFGPLDGGPVLTLPLLAYRDYLQDGTVAIVSQLDPDENFSLFSSGMTFLFKDRYLVVWGTEAEIDRAGIGFTVGRNTVLRVGADDLALTATYQERAFEDRCRQTVRPDSGLAITVRHGDDHVLKVYRSDDWIGLCTWDMDADNPADGLSINGPGTTVASSNTTALPQEFASKMSVIQSDGSGLWMAGVVPPGTISVDVTMDDGSVVPAQIGGDVYAVWLPGRGAHVKVVATTATEIWTADGDRVTHVPR